MHTSIFRMPVIESSNLCMINTPSPTEIDPKLPELYTLDEIGRVQGGMAL
jgi:hypothetical protein